LVDTSHARSLVTYQARLPGTAPAQPKQPGQPTPAP